MFNYTPQNQLDIFDFKTEFESKLDPNNRWVKMAKLLDWDRFAVIYAQHFSSTMGAKGIDARIVIGALIIKHIEAKDDRGTIEAIKENPYMQYFLGFDHFSSDPVFDPSLFVHIRKRLGNDDFDKMNQIIISKALNANGVDSESDSEKDGNDAKTSQETPVQESESNEQESKKTKNKGKLQLDATIADAHIKFPTDLSLLNDSREKSEGIIDKLCKVLGLQKPRTYRREARKNWLNLSKSKKKSYKQIQKGIKQQLNYLKRNNKHIDRILDENPLALGLLDKREYRYLLITKELYKQQLEMFQEKKHSVANRIVSIHQPHIRPMVRGKQGKNVEFGAKINVSLQQGFARIDQLDYEAFNEGIYLKEQVKNYKRLNGHFPELVQTDEIYMNRENRKFLKENNIRHTGKPLGRKPKEDLTPYQKKKLKKERGERNHVEGKFGQGKSKYKLNKIMARLAQTSESWIGAIFFIMNILKLTKDYFYAFLNWLFYWILFQNNHSKSYEMKIITL